MYRIAEGTNSPTNRRGRLVRRGWADRRQGLRYSSDLRDADALHRAGLHGSPGARNRKMARRGRSLKPTASFLAAQPWRVFVCLFVCLSVVFWGVFFCPTHTDPAVVSFGGNLSFSTMQVPSWR